MLPLFVATLFLLTPLSVSEATASAPQKITNIEDLLTDRDEDGKPDRLGEQVTVRGRATVGTNVLNNKYLLFYLQDRTAGIMVFSETLDVSVSKGDSLQVTGMLKLHASKPEIVVEDLKVLQSGKRIPEPKPLSGVFKDPEPYRGFLVSGEAVVQGRNPSKNIKMLRISPVGGSEDSLHIFVSRANIHYENFNFDALKAGDRIHIQGILIRYISDYLGKTLYQVLPRSPDDLTIGNLQPMVQEGSFIYADIDTSKGMIYMLQESGLWGYDLSNNSWRFLDALESLEEPFSSYEFGFNAQRNVIQLWSRGMGRLYSIDPQSYSINREGGASDHENQLGHFPFYRDSTLHSFGGYGFWNYHNMIVRFNQVRDEWELQPVDPSSAYPSRRIPQTGVYDSRHDRLYIFGGRGTESGNPKDQRSDAREFRDIWRFSFDSQIWERVLTLGQPENESGSSVGQSLIGKTNKQSSSIYLPDEQLWFIPTVDSGAPVETSRFSVVSLSTQTAKGQVSVDVGSPDRFVPTNYLYHPNRDEVLLLGIENITNANSFPVRLQRIPADSLTAKISDPPLYLSTKPYYFLIGIAIIGGFLFWYYSATRNGGAQEEQDGEELSYQELLTADWYNSQEQKLLEYMHEQNRFMDSNEIEELLWSDIESYDYRRRLRNDIIKEINSKFEKRHPHLGSIILRKKDPNDNRRYLYGLNDHVAAD